MYGNDLLQSLWDDHVNFCKNLHTKVVEFVDSRPDLKDVRVAIHEQLFHGLNKIRCPVLLVHGDKVICSFLNCKTSTVLIQHILLILSNRIP